MANDKAPKMIIPRSLGHWKSDIHGTLGSARWAFYSAQARR